MTAQTFLFNKDMKADNFSRDAIQKERIIPLVTIEKIDEVDKIFRALESSGLCCAEITFRTQCAAEAIAYAVKYFPKIRIGAGTVLNAAQCESALDAGAKFIISPGLSASVAEICRMRDVSYYPGCVTPTEIMQALALGLTVVKFFPADIYGGVKAVKALSAPFPQIKFIPTGGVTWQNANEYLRCDKIYAVGGSFFTKDALQKMASL